MSPRTTCKKCGAALTAAQQRRSEGKCYTCRNRVHRRRGPKAFTRVIKESVDLYGAQCTRPKTAAEIDARWRLSTAEYRVAMACARALDAMQYWRIRAKGHGHQSEAMAGTKPPVPAQIVDDYIDGRGYRDPADATRAKNRLLNAAIDLANLKTNYASGGYYDPTRRTA